MTITLDAEWVGGVLGAMISVVIATIGYLQGQGYIKKWKAKLSISNDVADEVVKQDSSALAKLQISNDVANEVIKQNHSALAKLQISDDILQVLQTHASDETGMIDHEKLITVLDNYKRIHELVTLKRPMSAKEQNEVCSIVFKILEDHKPVAKTGSGQLDHDQNDS